MKNLSNTEAELKESVAFKKKRVFGLNTGKCRPEKTPYLDTFHAVFT